MEAPIKTAKKFAYRKQNVNMLTPLNQRYLNDLTYK